MPAIPQVDITVNLFDAGYALPFDAGTLKFSVFGVSDVSPGANGVTLGGVKNVAQYPVTPNPVPNYLLAPTLTAYTTTQGAGFTQEGCLNVNANLILVMDITDIGTLGTINAKTQVFPGNVDYTNAGMIPLAIGNASTGMSFFCCQPIVFDDASLGFCISGFSNGTGTLPPGKYILMVKQDLSTSDWLSDEMHASFGLSISCTWLTADNRNLQADNVFNLPTLTTYLVTYNFITGQNATILGTGDVSNDCANAFGLAGGPNTAATYFTDNGIFGIDSVSGNNTGCWYCALDCSVFGRVTFVMPDASIGPSSSPTVWINFNGELSYQTYPQVDATGIWWWIRLPLCDGVGNIIVEPLSFEVYSSFGVAISDVSLYVPGENPPVKQLPFCVAERNKCQTFPFM